MGALEILWNAIPEERKEKTLAAINALDFENEHEEQIAIRAVCAYEDLKNNECPQCKSWDTFDSGAYQKTYWGSEYISILHCNKCRNSWVP